MVKPGTALNNCKTIWLASSILLAGLSPAPVSGGSLGEPVLSRGGVGALPTITSLLLPSRGATNVTVQWSGVGGPFQVETKPTLPGSGWEPIGAPTFSFSSTFGVRDGNSFFRVSTPPPRFAGADTCKKCHPDSHAEWSTTAHAGALGTLKSIGMDTNASCLPCHTVGFGVPTGFLDEVKTPHLAGVQCENCHGAGGDHASDPFGVVPPVLRPQAEMCGGCHSEVHHPTYEEWRTSKHAVVTPDVAANLRDPVSGLARMKSCGVCHSGAVRSAVVENVVEGTPLVFPDGETAATLPITCVTCHNPHAKTANNAQLWYPTASHEPYSYSTSATNTFAAQFNPAINVCGQCHNMRGAAWSDTSRSPHHSPQYNILIGNGGVESAAIAAVPPQSPHRNIEKQCAGCHTHPHPAASPSEATPNYMGHDFVARPTSCLPCHDSELAALLIESTQSDFTDRIAAIKGSLDQWGSTKAPDALRAKYGSLAWEYTNIGDLSTPTATVKTGPTAAEQNAVPDEIKQARFNLYLVAHDRSLGVHNGRYTRYLLKVAQAKVTAELAK